MAEPGTGAMRADAQLDRERTLAASRTASAGTGQPPVHSNRHKACPPERNGQEGGDQT